MPSHKLFAHYLLPLLRLTFAFAVIRTSSRLKS